MLLSERSESSQRIAKGEPHEISAHKRLISYDVSPLDSQRRDGGPFRGAYVMLSGAVHYELTPLLRRCR